MTELSEMIRLQSHYNMIEGLHADAIVLYNNKKKGFKPKYKWKDREAHFAYRKRQKEIFEALNATQKRLLDELSKPDIYNDLHGFYTGVQWDDKVKVNIKIPDSCVREQSSPDQGGASEGCAGTTKPASEK